MKKWMAGLCASLLAMPLCVAANPYPEKPVTVEEAFVPGGTDAVMRPIADRLSQMWGQPVIIDYKPGANGLLATQFLIRSRADGYTLLHHTTGVIQNLSLYDAPNYALKDLVSVVQIGEQPMALAVPSASPVRSLESLLSAAANKQEKLSYASAGAGHSSHIYSELLFTSRKLDVAHVPYRGIGQFLPDLLANRIQVAFISSAAAATYKKSGALRILAVTGTQHLPLLPDVPTFKELGFDGFDLVGWHGIFAPAGTPQAAVDRIGADVQSVLKDPKVMEILHQQGVLITGQGPKDFANTVRVDHQRWRDLITQFHIKAN